MAIHQYADTLANTSDRHVTVSNDVLARLAQCNSGSLTTQLFKLGFRQPALVGLRTLNKDIKAFAGHAFTIRFIPALEYIDTYITMTTKPNQDNLQWQGVEQIQPGDILVIDSQNDPRAASAVNIPNELDRPICWDYAPETTFDGADAVHHHLPHPAHIALVTELKKYFEWVAVDYTETDIQAA